MKDKAMTRHITAILIALTVYENPTEAGKRKLGKLAAKEICKMETRKFTKEVY